MLVVLSGCDSAGDLDGVYNNYFVKYYGGEGSQEGVDMVVDETDQTVVLLGAQTSPGGALRIYLMRIDWNGNVIWKYSRSGPTDLPMDLEVATDGSLIVLTQTRDNPAEPSDNSLNFKLVRFNSDGTPANDSVVFYTPQKSGVFANEYAETVTRVSDGYIVTGSTEYNTQWASGGLVNVSDLLHVKYNLSLQITTELDSTTSNSENEMGYKSVELSNGRVYSFGTSFKEIPEMVSNPNPPANNNFNFWILPLPIESLNDQVIGIRGAGNDEQVTAVCETQGSGYFVVGRHQSGGASRIYATRMYEDGGELYASQAQGQGIIAVPGHSSSNLDPQACVETIVGGSGFLIVANEGDAGFRNIWLLKTSDTDLSKVKWAASFGSLGRNDDRGAAVAELPDGRILVFGTVNLGGNNFKMALFKLNSGGKLAN
jgi:hypothetical protein